MRTINIFLTDPVAGDFPDFDNGDLRYAFARLFPDGPRRLVEGPVCAVVDLVRDRRSEALIELPEVHQAINATVCATVGAGV
ncbi:MAG: hypothetical protein VYA25_10810, partial [Pseudomonadota bacterium]|nr:hypothetical protein [Pseudomonadota bacterium]